MRSTTETIGTHTGPGASPLVHTIGRGGYKIANPMRFVQITGMAGTSEMKIQWSLNGADWNDAMPSLSNKLYGIPHGVASIRSVCVSYDSVAQAGNPILVLCQQFLED